MKEKLHKQEYDLTFKDIFKDTEDALIQLITGTKGEFRSYLDVNFQTIESRKSDIIFETTLENKSVIFHVEFQADNDSKMIYRMLRYLVEIHNQYKKPIFQVTIYAGKSKLTMDDRLKFKMSDETFIDYKYKIIDLNELTPEDIIKLDKVELLPTLVLTKVEKGKNKENHLKLLIDLIIKHTEDIDLNTRKNLFLKAKILSGIKFNQEMVKKVFDEVKKMFSLKDSAGYQLILEEGREEGRQIGIQEGEKIGIEKGEQIGIQKGKLLSNLEHKFGVIPIKIMSSIKKLNSMDLLNLALDNLAKAESIEDFMNSIKE